jgi:hypothetical protein
MTDSSCAHIAGVTTVKHPQRRECDECVKTGRRCVLLVPETSFQSGEAIWTESSYKYQPDEVVAMPRRAGFSALAQWTADGCGLTLATVTEHR